MSLEPFNAAEMTCKSFYERVMCECLWMCLPSMPIIGDTERSCVEMKPLLLRCVMTAHRLEQSEAVFFAVKKAMRFWQGRSMD